MPEGVKKVTSAGDADDLKSGDVIVSVNGSKLGPDRPLAAVVEQHAPGDTLRLGILQQGESRTVSVTLTPAP